MGRSLIGLPYLLVIFFIHGGISIALSEHTETIYNIQLDFDTRVNGIDFVYA